MHKDNDQDSSAFAGHHSLGTKHNQASAGDHNHNGSNSVRLMEGVTLTGSTGGNIALQNLIAELATVLGFEDATT